MDHPTIWKLIDGLRHVQKGRDAFHEHLVARNPPPRKLSHYRSAMKGFCEWFRDMPIMVWPNTCARLLTISKWTSSISDVLAGICLIFICGLVLSCTVWLQARNQGGSGPPEKKFWPLQNCVGLSSNVLDIVQNVLDIVWAPLGKLFAPPADPSWLRACVIVICIV